MTDNIKIPSGECNSSELSPAEFIERYKPEPGETNVVGMQDLVGLSSFVLFGDGGVQVDDDNIMRVNLPIYGSKMSKGSYSSEITRYTLEIDLNGGLITRINTVVLFPNSGCLYNDCCYEYDPEGRLTKTTDTVCSIDPLSKISMEKTFIDYKYLAGGFYTTEIS